MTREQIESIKVMRLQPGDVLVIKSSDCLSLHQRDALFECARTIIPVGVKCLVLDGGMDLDVLRVTDAAGAA